MISGKTKSPSTPKLGESGQSLIEYVIMMAVVASLFFGVAKALKTSGIAETLTKPLREGFMRAYQHGDPKAKGYDDGGPYRLVLSRDKQNFRVFLNSRKQ